MEGAPKGPHSGSCEFLHPPARPPAHPPTRHSWPTWALPISGRTVLVDVKLTPGADGSERGVVGREDPAGLAGGM